MQETQKDFISVFNHSERIRKQKANDQLKKLGLTIEDLERD